MSALVSVLPADLHLNPSDARKVATGIKKLADDINRRGLLESPGVRLVAGRYVVAYGNRRVRAIWELVERGAWPADKPVECLLRDTSDEASGWDALAENIQREEVPIWMIGQKFREYEDEGLSQTVIGANVGRSPGYVSMASRIARGLHPAIIERLNKSLPEQPSRAVLVRMSQKVDLDTLEADLAAQTKVLEQAALSKGAWSNVRKRVGVSQKTVLYKRFRALKDGAPKIPEHAEDYFAAMMNYLSGASKKLSWPKDV